MGQVSLLLYSLLDHSLGGLLIVRELIHGLLNLPSHIIIVIVRVHGLLHRHLGETTHVLLRLGNLAHLNLGFVSLVENEVKESLPFLDIDYL